MNFERQRKREQERADKKAAKKASNVRVIPTEDNLKSMFERGYEKGNNAGYDEGYAEGKEKGLREGVRLGVEKGALFAVSCFESALKNTKGVGEALRGRVTDTVNTYFNSDVPHLRYPDVESQELFQLRLIRHVEYADAKTVLNFVQRYNEDNQSRLTVSDILSILNHIDIKTTLQEISELPKEATHDQATRSTEGETTDAV